MTIPSYEQAKEVETQSFSLTLADDTQFQLTLNSVSYQKYNADFPGKQQCPFSLFFVGAPHLQQGTYALRNDNAGEWVLFIVPIAHDRATGEYTFQALINT